MKHQSSIDFRFSVDTVLIVTTLLLCLAVPARADKKSVQAREQFEQAVKMRTMLEGFLPRDRSIDDYKQTIAAFQKVYFTSTQAPEVTPSLIAEAELYREMGRLYDPQYYDSAISMYKFLLSQYPETRYRGEVLFAIAVIQKDDQHALDAAEATLKQFLKQYPKNDKAEEAREALADIGGEREKAAAQVANANPSASENNAQNPPERGGAAEPVSRVTKAGAIEDVSALGPVVEPREPSKAWACVKSVDASNASDHTRIIVGLDDTVQFESAHLHSPDRIFFDLHKARVGSKVSGKSINFDSGLLKSVRVGQNRPDVVRVVLDAASAKDYSAVLVGKPYRLIIDLRTAGAGGAKVTSKEASSSTPAVSPALTVQPAETVAVNTDEAAAPN